jgi:EAL domain-containing protein (putative c-di-GMP-specific phosphodiesterase class I)
VLLLQNLSETMQLTLVAEGVEDRDVLALLQEAGLNRFQGYLFAKAQSPEELVRNTASQPPTPAA